MGAKARASATRCCCPREHVRIAVRIGLHADLLQHFGDPGATLRSRPTGQPERHVVGDRQVREKGVILEQEPQPPPLRRDIGGAVRHDGAPDRNAAGGRMFQAGSDPERGGLAATGGAE